MLYPTMYYSYVSIDQASEMVEVWISFRIYVQKKIVPNVILETIVM